MKQYALKIRPHHYIAVIAIVTLLATLVFSPINTLFSEQQQLTAGLIGCALILFATSVLPEYVTALLLMAGAMLLQIAPASVVFSGFASTACWLIFAGLIIGIAINTTGLTTRVAGLFSPKMTHSYPVLITTTVVIAMTSGFLMPSSIGRAILLMPIAVAIAKRCGFCTTDNGYIGVALAAAFGCHVPTFSILPANVPNMVFIGAAETIHQWTPAYGDYLLLHFPLLGFAKALILIALILRFYPDIPKQQQRAPQTTALSTDEIKLLLLLITTLILWVTDSIHHISAAWIGLTTACILLLPGIGLVNKQQFNSQFNIGSLLFVVGILSLGAIINDSGLGNLMGNYLNTWLPLSPDTPFINFMVLAFTAGTTAIVTTLPGVPAVLTPFAQQLSLNSGFSIETVLMTQVLGYSTVVFTFQSAPLVVAMQLSGVPLSHAAKLCIPLTLVTIAILFPLDYIWWLLLGYIE